MLNAIIIDDEKPAIEVLRILLEKTGKVRVVGSFLSATQALLEVENLKPDVAFLDIEMPEMSGIELAGKMVEAGHNIEIVFVTAFDKYALEAFRVNAIDYILKPLSLEDILQTIKRLRKINPLKSLNELPAEIPTEKGHISCFGRLSVCYAKDGETVKWRTSKAEELFAFMLQNLNTEISKWKITQVLWPECETEKLNIYLHTTIYKMKKTLVSSNIKFDFGFVNGRYKLELPDVYIDTREFETITNTKITVSETSLDVIEKAINLYKGNYLEENEYHWSQSKAEEYSIKYRSLVSKLAMYYINKADYTNAEKIIQQALAKVPLDDDLNEMLLKLYFLKKDKVSLIRHYNKIKEQYNNELGIAPSAIMQGLFNTTI